MSAPSVAEQKAIVAAAARKYGIDPAFLWGVYGTETSFGHNLSTSSTGAQGYFQFEPATARAYGVNPYDFKSAAFGAAHLLSTGKSGGELGMVRVFYGAPDPGYLANVHRYAQQFGRVSAASIAAPGVSDHAAAGGQLFTATETHGFLYALVWAAIVAAGVALTGIGINHAAGGAPARAARKTGKAAALGALV